MATLLTMYQSDLKSKGVDASSYSKQYLKALLQKRYGDELIFHMPTARFKPDLRTGGPVVEHWAVTREVVSSTPAGPKLRVLK